MEKLINLLMRQNNNHKYSTLIYKYFQRWLEIDLFLHVKYNKQNASFVNKMKIANHNIMS